MDNKLSQRFIVFSTILLLTVVISSIYFHVLEGEFILDDYTSVVNGINIESLNPIDHFKLLRPLGNYTFALNHALHGQNVFGYHLINILIHIFNSILVFLFIRQLFSAPKIRNSGISKNRDVVSFFTALLFAVHPIQTQAVSYITQRLESLSTMFFLSAFILYFQSVFFEQNNEDKKKIYSLYASSAALFLFALLSKESTIVLFLIIPLAELMLFGFSVKRFGRNCLTALMVLLVIFVIVLSAFNISDLYSSISGATFLEKLDSVSRETDEISRKDYLITQVNVIRVYLTTLLLPVDLNLDHGYPVIDNIKSPMSLFSLGMIVLTLLTGILLFRKNRLILFGILFFYITMLPTSSIIPIRDTLFEHRLYLPSAGYFLAFVMFFIIVAESFRGTRFLSRISGWSDSLSVIFSSNNKRIILLLILCNIFAFGTFKRNTLWVSEEAMWKDVIKKAPKNWRGYANLSEVYRRKGQFDEQARALHSVLIHGAGLEDIDYYAFNLSLYYYTRGEFENALFYFNRTTEIDENFGEAYFYKGRIFREQKDYPNSISAFETALTKPMNLRIIPVEAVQYHLGMAHYEILSENRTGQIYPAEELVDKNSHHKDEAVKYLTLSISQNNINMNKQQITDILAVLEKM